MATQAPPVQITAAPSAGQIVEHEGKLFTTIREGKAYILVPPNAQTSVDPRAKSKPENGSQAQNVFYNPIQQFNRDLSVLAIKAFGEDVCQRKSQRHEQQRGKTERRKEKKRKKKDERHEVEDAISAREAAKSSVAGAEQEHTNADSVEEGNKSPKRRRQDEDEDDQESPVKLRKLDDAPNVNPEDDLHEAEMGGPSVAGPKQEGMGMGNDERDGSSTAGAEQDPTVLMSTTDEGVTVSQGNEANATTVSPTIQSPQLANDGTAADEVNNAKNPQQSYRPKFRILDALSATGLRALRYASEIPFTTEVVANDKDRNAVKSIKTNVEYNKLSTVIATEGDALGHMYGVAHPLTHSHGPNHVSGKYDVVDLDPYGTAAPFIDAALQALEDGGLLCVTSTDSAVFASCGYSEKTFALYGGMPIKGNHSHEGGLRLLLHAIATSASKYGIAIEPLLSLSIDFYVRLFVRVQKSPSDVKFLAGKTMLVYECDHGCGAWTTQFIGRHKRHQDSENWKYMLAQAPSANELCEHCGSKTHIAGPMWGGPLHNPAFIEKMLDDLKGVDQDIYQTKPRIEGMLDTALNELVVHADTMDLRSGAVTTSRDDTKEIVPKTPPEAIDRHPFFFVPSALCKVVKAQAPPENMVKGALRHLGYRATRSHCKAGSIKTDAPWTVIWEIVREWIRQEKPIKPGALQDFQPGWKILQSTREPDDESNAGGRADGQANINGSDNSNSEATPDVVTEATNGMAKQEKAVDVKKLKIIFDEKLGRDKPGKRLVRYQENPRENWGPMKKAKGSGC